MNILLNFYVGTRMHLLSIQREILKQNIFLVELFLICHMHHMLTHLSWALLVINIVVCTSFFGGICKHHVLILLFYIGAVLQEHCSSRSR